jgi:hypothetical protein
MPPKLKRKRKKRSNDLVDGNSYENEILNQVSIFSPANEIYNSELQIESRKPADMNTPDSDETSDEEYIDKEISDEFYPEEYMDDEDLYDINDDEEVLKIFEENYENAEQLIAESQKMTNSDSQELPPAKKQKTDTESAPYISDNKSPSISIITWNVQKFGRKGKKEILKEKSEAIARILDQVNPMIMVMQEVSDADFLFNGNEIPGGKTQLTGLKSINLFDEYQKDIKIIHLFRKDLVEIQKSVNNIYNYPPKKITVANLGLNESRDLVDLINNYLALTEEDGFKSIKDILNYTDNTQSYKDATTEYINLRANLNQIDANLSKIDSDLSKSPPLPTGKKRLTQVQREQLAAVKIKMKAEKEKLESERKEVLAKYKIAKSFFYILMVLENLSPNFSNGTDELLDSEKEKLINELKQPYLLSTEYEMLKGPKFAAGIDLNATPDHYPVFYNKAAIHGHPELYIYNLDTKVKEKLNYEDFDYTIRYGTLESKKEIEKLNKKIAKETEKVNKNGDNDSFKKKSEENIKLFKNLIDQIEKKELDVVMSKKTDLKNKQSTIIQQKIRDKIEINRCLVLWKFKLPLPTNHNFRSFKMDNEWNPLFSLNRTITLSYTELYVGVVHTSPSIKIKNEITNILACAEDLLKEGIPILLGGDWYMEKKSIVEFRKLKNDENEKWTLIAPKNLTNFPGKGTGQVADHFIVQKLLFANVATKSLPPPIYVKGVSGEIVNTPWGLPYSIDEYSAWTKIKVDHTPVYSLQNIQLKPEQIKQNQYKMSTNPIYGSYIKHGDTELTTENYAHQVYITQGVLATYIGNGGEKKESRIGKYEYTENTTPIDQLITPLQPTFPVLKLSTSDLAYFHLLTFADATNWDYAKGILTEQGTIENYTGVLPDVHDDEKGDRSCIYASGITKGFGLILAAHHNNNWYVSAANSKNKFQDQSSLANLFFSEDVVNHELLKYNAILCINRIYNDDNESSSIIQNILPQLNQLGIDSKQVTIYQSYGTGYSNFLSIGIDSNGIWGEVLDESPKPYKG